VDYQERKKEVLFTSEGVGNRALDAKSQEGVTRIIEPNGETKAFSDQAKKKELRMIADRQKSLLTQLDYSYHRIKRYIKKKIDR
jgi:hypothetical protein